MSASLVGSEMCIRDRPPPAQRAALNRPSGWASARSINASFTASFHRAEAVSYTHLTLPTICSV
eukprot:11293317-Alexandrium_andersonii.AAC.1